SRVAGALAMGLGDAASGPAAQRRPLSGGRGGRRAAPGIAARALRQRRRGPGRPVPRSQRRLALGGPALDRDPGAGHRRAAQCAPAGAGALGPLTPGEHAMEEQTPGPPHLIVVDAHAVIEGAEPLRVLWKRDPGEAARGLINLLSWAMGEQHVAFRVMLDHAVDPGDIDDEPGHLEIRRARSGQSVSALMISELEDLLG